MRLPTFYEQNLIPNWGMTLHTLCGIHAGKGNEQETIMDYKTSKLYKQNEKVILFIQPSYGNSNRIKFV